jgi:hypothetical protein
MLVFFIVHMPIPLILIVGNLDHVYKHRLRVYRCLYNIIIIIKIIINVIIYSYFSYCYEFFFFISICYIWKTVST